MSESNLYQSDSIESKFKGITLENTIARTMYFVPLNKIELILDPINSKKSELVIKLRIKHKEKIIKFNCHILKEILTQIVSGVNHINRYDNIECTSLFYYDKDSKSLILGKLLKPPYYEDGELPIELFSILTPKKFLASLQLILSHYGAKNG